LIGMEYIRLDVVLAVGLKSETTNFREGSNMLSRREVGEGGCHRSYCEVVRGGEGGVLGAGDGHNDVRGHHVDKDKGEGKGVDGDRKDWVTDAATLAHNGVTRVGGEGQLGEEDEAS
jgi:hypothetical protein